VLDKASVPWDALPLVATLAAAAVCVLFAATSEPAGPWRARAIAGAWLLVAGWDGVDPFASGLGPWIEVELSPAERRWFVGLGAAEALLPGFVAELTVRWRRAAEVRAIAPARVRR
jgi:hypothetical protein